MLIVLAILSVGLLVFIIYLAFSPKSSRFMKLAALLALALIGISLAISAVFLIIGPGEDSGGIPFPVFPDAPPTPPRQTNIAETLVVLAVFLGVMGMIVVLAVRERRNKNAPRKEPERNTIFQKSNDLRDSELEKKGDDSKENNEFDLGIDFDDN
jgi:hypothetical protein